MSVSNDFVSRRNFDSFIENCIVYFTYTDIRLSGWKFGYVCCWAVAFQ